MIPQFGGNTRISKIIPQADQRMIQNESVSTQENYGTSRNNQGPAMTLTDESIVNQTGPNDSLELTHDTLLEQINQDSKELLLLSEEEGQPRRIRKASRKSADRSSRSVLSKNQTLQLTIQDPFSLDFDN